MNYASRLPVARNSDVDGFSVPKSVITKLCGRHFSDGRQRIETCSVRSRGTRRMLVNFALIFAVCLQFQPRRRAQHFRCGGKVAASSRLAEGDNHFEYRMTIKSQDRSASETLSKHLRGPPEVVEFRITPTGD